MDARPALIVAAALLAFCSAANSILKGSPAGGAGGAEVQVLGTQIGTTGSKWRHGHGQSVPDVTEL